MCEVRGVIRWPKDIISPSQKWSDEEPGGRTSHPIVQYNNQTLHITASRHSSPRYIRVQWPWIGMIQYDICGHCHIQNRSESPWWRYTKDHDLHDGWKCLTYTGIKSRDLKSHEHWHDQGGSISKMPPIWKVFYTTTTSTCPTMWIEMSRSNIVVHRLIIGHWCIPLIDARSPTDNENGNQGTRVQTNKCE